MDIHDKKNANVNIFDTNCLDLSNVIELAHSKQDDISTYVEVGDYIQCLTHGRWYDAQVQLTYECDDRLADNIIVRILENDSKVSVENVKRIRPIRYFNGEGIPLWSTSSELRSVRKTAVLKSLTDWNELPHVVI
eukprot:UN09393